jgi:uncharacterized protein with PIN domain
MGIWKMDMKMAEWIKDNLEELKKKGHFNFSECEKCGASYIRELGHNCDNVIELVTETKEAD